MPGQGSPDQRLVFDDFSKGEFGRLDATHAPPGSFTANNLIVWQDGLMGPRPGLKKATTSGNASGTVWGLHYIGLSGKMLAVIIGNTVYRVSTDGNGTMTFSSLGTLSATPTEHVHFEVYDPNATVYLSNPGDRTYSIDWTGAGAPTAFNVAADTRGFRAIRRYRDRLFLTGDPETGSPGNRVYYSEPADFSNFPSTNWFDVDYFNENYALLPNFNHLVIPQRITGWFALRGGDPINGEVIQFEQDSVPIDASGKQHEMVKEGGSIWFFRHGNFLAVTDGAKVDVTSWQHLRMNATSATRHGIYMTNQGQDLFFLDGPIDTAFHRHYGVWTSQNFGVNLSGPLCNTEFHERILMVGGDSGGTAGNYYSYDLSLGARPPFTSDTYARPGDDTDTPNTNYVYFPDFGTKDGKEGRVRQILVDFKKWNTGVTTNSFSAVLRTQVRRNVDNYAETTYAWSEAASQTDTSGQFDRFVINTGEEGYGAGFQVGVKNLIGVGLQSITVVFEDSPEAPVS